MSPTQPSVDRTAARGGSAPVDGGRSADEPSADELAAGAWLAMYRLLRSEEATRNALDAAEAEQLTSQQFVALLALPLDTARGMRMRELARCCNSTPSYATSIVDALEERGFVVRQRDPDDRRATEVRLTDDGLQAVGRCHTRLAVPPSGLRDLSVEELRTLRDLLERAAAPYPWPL